MHARRTRGAPAMALAVAMVFAPLASEAGAVIESFFGEDLNGTGLARARPNADAAFSAFMRRAPGAIAEDFEESAVVLPPAFGGELSSSDLASVAEGRFAISGSRYALLTSRVAPGAGFALDMPLPATAFGFFGVDIGDFNESLSLRLEFADGTAHDLVVAHTRDSADANGAVFFQGLLTDTPIDTVRVINLNPGGGTASLVFDDLIVGRALPVPVSVAGTLTLLAPAALSAVAIGRRRARKG